MKSGVLAAETINEVFRSGDFSAARLSRYERDCRRAFRLRRGINAVIRFLVYRPALTAPFIRFSARQRRPLDSIVHAICSEAAR